MPATKTYDRQPWADASEAAEILDVSIRTVYTYCREGRLPARKIKGVWKIDRDALRPTREHA
jgi:excisionase family DNA binding protein